MKKEAVCPHCKKKFNIVTKTSMLTEILKIVNARDQKPYFSSLTWEQTEDIYNWIKKIK